MDKKLSVLQRTTDKTGWDKSNQFSTSDVNDIKVFTARNDKSLNAIPSPLARIHLFEAAFDLLDKDELNNTNFSGDTYKKIVSDCFDVFELIYNWNNHIREKKQLTIVKWNREHEIEILKKSSLRHKLLGETLEVFLNQESFENFSDILILKLNNQVVAGSSPFTGFFTTPNDLSSLNFYNPLSRRNYFSKIVPFKERKPEIKKFIYDFFDKSNLRRLSSTQIIRNYLSKYRSEIEQNLLLPLEPINSSYNQLFNETLKSSSRKSEFDYFEKNLIKINYRINDECFCVPIFVSERSKDRKHDYLLPLTTTFFEDFQPEDISSLVTVNEIDDKTVEVSIRNNNQKFAKKYQVEKIFEEDGEIIELDKSHSIKINLGIFPFFKVKGDTPFNDFYKVMFACQDNNYRYSNGDFQLSFGINKTIITPPTTNNYITSLDHRTILERDRHSAGSTYYSLKGRNGTSVCFDFIQIKLPSLSGSEIKCTVVPKWKSKVLGTKQIDYAIDFGTTTTFIAYTEDPKHENKPEPFSFDINPLKNEKDIPTEFLHKPKKKGDQYNWIACYEEASLPDFLESLEIQKQEFLPSLLNKEKYSLPFRTVTYEKDSILENQKNLFANANISFIYGKQDNNATHINQHYVSNLKWNVKTDKSYEESIEIFVEEIFLFLRLKALMHDADPRKSRIAWFSPLSFTPDAQKGYKKIWEKKYNDIIKGDVAQLSNITESEAPFYFYSKEAKIEDPSSVLTLDIGGGTTDIMYVKNNRPSLCTSVHFGANILWGNGFNEFKNAKDNGIYQSLRQTIISRVAPTTLKNLNETFVHDSSPFGSDEIINFWISNDDKTDVIRELDKGAYRLTYMLHLSALIYHSYKLLNYQGQPLPTCIIFSGNGSKYLDLIQSKDYIENICGYIGKKVFSQSAKNPQIILPKENRKEATCYGGLYQPFNQSKAYQSVNYLGFEKRDEQTFSKYSEINHQKDLVFANLANSFSEFIDCFFGMNDISELSFRMNFGIEANLSAIKNYLLSKAIENLEVGYEKRKKNVGDDDPVTDSLFFYPLMGLLHKINKLSKEEVNEFIPKAKLYAVSSDGVNGFSIDKLTPDKKPDSIFSITIDEEHPDLGELTIIGESSVHKRALSSIEGYLKPVCEWKEYPSTPNQLINVIKCGTVEKKNNSWTVKEKIQIEFI